MTKKLDLHLRTRGVMSYLPTRKPSDKELSTCDRFELSSANCWEPYMLSLDGGIETSNVSLLESLGAVYSQATRSPAELREDLNDRFVHALQSQHITTTTDPHEAYVIMHSVQCRDLLAINSDSRKSVLMKEVIAQRWFTLLGVPCSLLLKRVCGLWTVPSNGGLRRARHT